MPKMHSNAFRSWLARGRAVGEGRLMAMNGKSSWGQPGTVPGFFREQLGGAVSRTQYQKMLEEDVRVNTAEREFTYKKNDPRMFARLKNCTPEAIRRAERALDNQLKVKGTSWSDMNPATRVHELVRSLMAYL